MHERLQGLIRKFTVSLFGYSPDDPRWDAIDNEIERYRAKVAKKDVTVSVSERTSNTALLIVKKTNGFSIEREVIISVPDPK